MIWHIKCTPRPSPCGRSIWACFMAGVATAAASCYNTLKSLSWWRIRSAHGPLWAMCQALVQGSPLMHLCPPAPNVASRPQGVATIMHLVSSIIYRYTGYSAKTRSLLSRGGGGHFQAACGD